MAFSNYLNSNILDYVFGGESFTPPSEFYVALYTSETTEVSASDYERMTIEFGSATNNEIKNSTEVRFPIALSDWGEVTHIALFDAETGGNLLDIDDAESVHDVKENTRYTIPVDNLTIILDKCEE